MKITAVAKNVAIRTARASDAQALAELLGQLGYPNTASFVQSQLKRLSKRNDRVFVAVLDRKVIGFASCHIMPLMHQSGNLCRITALIVAQGFRSCSIGLKLMRVVENYARSRRCTKIEVTSGRHRNKAHRFYERLGYCEMSRRFLKDLST